MEESSSKNRSPSDIPSWIMLGFALGALLVWGIERPRRSEPAGGGPQALPASPPPPSAAPQPGPISTSLSTVENVFSEWSRFAVWENDATEIAIWNTHSRGYDEYFEVMRIGDQFYFRSISRLTRPILTHGGVPPECPLQFTESEQQRQQWLRENPQAQSEESLKALGVSLGNKSNHP